MEHGKAMYVFVACFVSLSIFVRGILICHPWLPLMPHYSLHREHWSTAPAHTHSGWIFSPLQCTAALHPSNGTSVELFYFEILTKLLDIWTCTTTLPQTGARCVPRISDSSVSRSAGVQQPGICSAEAPHAAIMTMHCSAAVQLPSPVPGRMYQQRSADWEISGVPECSRSPRPRTETTHTRAGINTE